LYWNVSLDSDRQNGVIHFAAEVATSGWIGFGISASGAMIDTDSIIGWTHTKQEGGINNTVAATDRYNTEYSQPAIDLYQDNYDIKGTQGMMEITPPPVNPIYYNVPSSACKQRLISHSRQSLHHAVSMNIDIEKKTERCDDEMIGDSPSDPSSPTSSINASTLASLLVVVLLFSVVCLLLFVCLRKFSASTAGINGTLMTVPRNAETLAARFL